VTVNGTGFPIIVPAAFENVIVPVQDSVTGVLVVVVVGTVIVVVVGSGTVAIPNWPQRLQSPTAEIVVKTAGALVTLT
jgi:hypothetical protein